MLKLISAVSIAVLLTACGSQHLGKPETAAPASVVSSYAITRDVVVSPPGWPKTLLADLYTPSGTGPFPSVLLVHGGAWKRGDRAQVKSLAERIAARWSYACTVAMPRRRPGTPNAADAPPFRLRPHHPRNPQHERLEP